jgi:hypothetical protein
MLRKDMHMAKALVPMLVTFAEIDMLVNAEHSQNAESPMLVTLEGILTLVMDEQ